MGILDFREICSPSYSHKSSSHVSPGKSNLSDDFELFCQEFFEIVKGYRLFRSVSNGPDFGIDLGVEDHVGKKWLVSCKHYAHSGSCVSYKRESNIIERVGSWGCDGFIPFYAAVPTNTLAQSLIGAESFIEVKRYYKERIERELLESSEGVGIAARYFPNSLINHYRNFIKPSDRYSIDDLKVDGNLLSIADFSYMKSVGSDKSDSEIAECLAMHANIVDGLEKHKPYFKKALLDAVRSFPFSFSGYSGVSSDIENVKPSWKIDDLIFAARSEGLSKAYFIASVWSFWDHEKANMVFSEFMMSGTDSDIREQYNTSWFRESEEYKQHLDAVLRRGLLTPGFLGIKLQDKERDILARLLAYANVL